MDKEIEKLLALISEINARAEAAESLLAACTVVVKDDPRFHAALVAIHNSRMAGSLNNGASDSFISAFENHLVALTPPELRHLVQ
jgi:hypothetical protein